MTKFGQVNGVADRRGRLSPLGRLNVHPADAWLNLPEEKHSHGLREARRGRGCAQLGGGACAAVTRATRGAGSGNGRQEGLVPPGSAIDVEGLRPVAGGPSRAGWYPPGLTLPTGRASDDGAGGCWRDTVSRAAAEGELATCWSRREKHGRKRMAELARARRRCPGPAHPQEITNTPRRSGERETSVAAKREGSAELPQLEARGKWLTASVTDDIPAVIAAAFYEADRPHPQHQRYVVVLAMAADRCRHRGCSAPPRHGHDRYRLHPRAGIPVEGRLALLRQGRALHRGDGSLTRPRSCTGRPARSRPGSAAAPPPTATPRPSPPRRRCARYLEYKQGYCATPPRWRRAAHRHRDHPGRVQLSSRTDNGREMGTRSAEAVLELRALTATIHFDATGASISAGSMSASTTSYTASTSPLQRNQLTSKEPHPRSI